MTALSTARYPGLLLVTQAGAVWRWIETFIVENRRGEEVAVHRFRSACRACGVPIERTTKLPKWARYRYTKRRLKDPREDCRGDIYLRIPRASPITSLQARNCPAHLRMDGPLLEFALGVQDLV